MRLHRVHRLTIGTRGRWELMYRLAWRTLHENPRLLEDEADPDVRSAMLMERAVNRECHKMHAFVRFREVDRARGRQNILRVVRAGARNPAARRRRSSRSVFPT